MSDALEQGARPVPGYDTKMTIGPKLCIPWTSQSPYPAKSPARLASSLTMIAVGPFHNAWRASLRASTVSAKLEAPDGMGEGRRRVIFEPELAEGEQLGPLGAVRLVQSPCCLETGDNTARHRQENDEKPPSKRNERHRLRRKRMRRHGRGELFLEQRKADRDSSLATETNARNALPVHR